MLCVVCCGEGMRWSGPYCNHHDPCQDRTTHRVDRKGGECREGAAHAGPGQELQAGIEAAADAERAQHEAARDVDCVRVCWNDVDRYSGAYFYHICRRLVFCWAIQTGGDVLAGMAQGSMRYLGGEGG